MDEIAIYVKDSGTVFERYPLSDIKFMDIFQDDRGVYRLRVFCYKNNFETVYALDAFTFCHCWEVDNVD